MTVSRSRLIAICAATVLLVVAGVDVATYAGTGDSLILGRVNQANKPTTVRNTGTGPALRIVSRPNASPFSVNSTKKVKKLNADRVDGLNGPAIQNRSFVLTDDDTTTVHAAFATWELSSVPPGPYLISYSASLDQASTPFDAVCGVTSSFLDITAGNMSQNDGSWIDTWISGSGFRTVDPAADFLFCQSQANFTLKIPLVITLTPVANVMDRDLVETPLVGPRAGSGAARR